MLPHPMHYALINPEKSDLDDYHIPPSPQLVGPRISIHEY